MEGALESMALHTIAAYWVKAVAPEYRLALKCARDQADRDGLRFTQKEINTAVRRAFNRLSDREREELYTTVERPDIHPRVEEDLGPLTSPPLRHQDEDEVQNQDKAQDERYRQRGKGARSTEGAAEQPETYDLLERYAQGVLMPVPVQLGAMPAGATTSMRSVAGDMALLIGLRLAVDEDRPLLYSTSFCAWRMGWELASGEPDKRRASRVINKLLGARVIQLAGEMPGTGTRLFCAPSAAVVIGPAPEVPAVSGKPTVDPTLEVSQQAVVHQTEPVLGQHLGVVAARHAAAPVNHRS